MMRSRRTLILAVLQLCISFTAYARVAYLKSGKWSQIYQYHHIEPQDTVIVSGNVVIDMPLLIQGKLEITAGANFSGFKPLNIAPGGSLINYVNLVVRSILNNGLIQNNSIIDLLEDLENVGSLQNNHVINCARSFYCHKGSMSGTNSQYYIQGVCQISKIVSIETENLSIKIQEE